MIDWLLPKLSVKGLSFKKESILNYTQISYKSDMLAFTINNFVLKTNALGLLFYGPKLISLNIGDISIELFKRPERQKLKTTFHDKNSKDLSPSQIASHALLYYVICTLTKLIKYIALRIQSIHLKYKQLELNINGFQIVYLKRSYQFQIDLFVGKSDISINNEKFIMQEIKSSSLYDIAPLLSIYNYESLLIPIEVTFSTLEIETKKNQILIHSLPITVLLPHGKLQPVFPDIIIHSSVDIPSLRFDIKHFSFFKSIALINVQQLNLDVLYLKVKKIILYNEEREVLKVKRITLDNKYQKLDISSQSLIFTYNTLTGLAVIPFLAKYIRHRPYDPIHHLRVHFPDIKIGVEKVLVYLKCSDTAMIKIDVGTVGMDNRIIDVPNLAMYWNSSKTITARPIKITDDNGYLRIIAGKLHFHDRKEFFIVDFLREFIKAWRAIAPYVLDKNLEKESISFPLMVEADVLSGKFHDFPLNKHISRSTRVMPQILLNNSIRQFLFQQKTDELKNLSEKALEKGHNQLTKIAFNEYRKSIQETQMHSYQIFVNVIKPRLILNCTDFVNKVDKIHDYDPTTKELYPDVQWEFLIGGQFDFKADLASVKFFDIEEPLILLENLSFEGPGIIAEVKNKESGPVPLTIDQQTVIVYKNPCDVKFFADGKIDIGSGRVIYGTAYRRIYQTVNDTVRLFIPFFPDPSPRPEWWDILRNQIRGRFTIKIHHGVIRVSASDIYTNTKDYLALAGDKIRVWWKESNFYCKVHLFQAERIGEGKEQGITIAILPHLEVNFLYTFITQNGKDPRLHMIMPDIKTFNDPHCDSYADYRSIGLQGDMHINFSMSHQNAIVPNITCDFAHFGWCFKPLMMMAANSVLNFNISNKYHLPHKKKNIITNINQLLFNINLSISCNLFDFRVYDHFPIADSKIRGTSLDSKINAPNLKFNITYHNSNFEKVLFDCSIKEVSFHTTDIAQYSEIQGNSTSFFSIKPIHFVSENTINKFSSKSIKFHFNQIILKYILEFVQSAKEIAQLIKSVKRQKNAAPTPIKSPAIVDVVDPNATYDGTYQRFTETKALASCEQIRMILSSIDTDLAIVLDLNHCMATMLTEKGTGCISYKYSIDSISSFTNALTPNINSCKSILMCKNTIIFVTSKNFFAITDSVNLKMSPSELTGYKLVVNECMTLPSFLPKEKSSLEKYNEKAQIIFAFSLNIPHLNGELHSDENVILCTVEARSTKLKMNAKSDYSHAITFSIDELNIKDCVERMLYPTIFSKWTQVEDKHSENPHLMAQLVSLPACAGCIQYAHAEINIEPSMFCYEKEFLDLFLDFFNHEIPKRPRMTHIEITDSNHSVKIPYVTYQSGLFPEAESKITDIVSSMKSPELSLIHDPQTTSILIRYFRLNPFQVKIWYKNPQGKLLQEVNGFVAQMTEVLYHDYSGTMKQFISTLKKEISHVLLPQLMKHVVGIKGKVNTNDQDLDEWLNCDDDNMDKTEKRKAMLFGHKNTVVKKK